MVLKSEFRNKKKSAIVGIIDTETANLKSVIYACEKNFLKVHLIKKYENILNDVDGLIFPGVGSYNFVMEILKRKKLTLLNRKNFVQFIKDRPGHDTRYAINSDLFYKKTKFKIKNNIKTGIKKTIEWYLKNIDWVNFQKKRYTSTRIGLDDK